MVRILNGGSVPFVLKPVSANRFEVGDAYAYEIIDSEAMDEARGGRYDGVLLEYTYSDLKALNKFVRRMPLSPRDSLF